MQAAHRGECSGSWSRVRWSGASLWACGGCGACYPDRPDVEEAIWTETLLGAELQRLTAEGRDLLGGSTRHADPS